jgi:hypothetical protein
LTVGVPWILGHGRFLVIAVMKSNRRINGTVFEATDGTRFVVMPARTRKEANAVAAAAGPASNVFAVRHRGASQQKSGSPGTNCSGARALGSKGSSKHFDWQSTSTTEYLGRNVPEQFDPRLVRVLLVVHAQNVEMPWVGGRQVAQEFTRDGKEVTAFLPVNCGFGRTSRRG